jgi:hypothetical protein
VYVRINQVSLGRADTHNIDFSYIDSNEARAADAQVGLPDSVAVRIGTVNSQPKNPHASYEAIGGFGQFFNFFGMKYALLERYLNILDHVCRQRPSTNQLWASASGQDPYWLEC